MKQFGLGKAHKLCSKTAIDRLFDSRAQRMCADSSDAGKSLSALAYPLRAVWSFHTAPRIKGEQAQFLITVPKKRLHHAVDRVAMRRKIREAYRLNRIAAMGTEPQNAIDIAFIYIADNIEPYARIEKAMKKLLQKIFSPVQ